MNSALLKKNSSISSFSSSEKNLIMNWMRGGVGSDQYLKRSFLLRFGDHERLPHPSDCAYFYACLSSGQPRLLGCERPKVQLHEVLGERDCVVILSINEVKISNFFL